MADLLILLVFIPAMIAAALLGVMLAPVFARVVDRWWTWIDRRMDNWGW